MRLEGVLLQAGGRKQGSRLTPVQAALPCMVSCDLDAELAVCADIWKRDSPSDPDKVSCAISWKGGRWEGGCCAKTGTLHVKALNKAKLLDRHQLKVPGSQPKLSSSTSTPQRQQ